MLTREQAGDIFDRIKKLSSADDVEVLFSGGRFALTRFANNTIHQNVAEENHVVSVRTAFGGRTARAFTNKFDDESLRQVVKASESLAKVQHPDPDLLPMPDAGEAAGLRPGMMGERPSHTIGRQTAPSRHYEQTAAITPEVRAEGVRKIVDVADRAQSDHRRRFLEWRVIRRHFQLTRVEPLASSDFGGSFDHDARCGLSGWQKANSPDVTQVEPSTLAEIAARRP